jgi:hypothetical protein
VSEADDIENVRRARAVAQALLDGDIDALADVSDLLRATGASDKIADFIVQLIFELLPDKAREWMEAKAAEGGHNNVIDLFTRKPRD